MAHQQKGLCPALAGDECSCVPGMRRGDTTGSDDPFYPFSRAFVVHPPRFASSSSEGFEVRVDPSTCEGFLRALTKPMASVGSVDEVDRGRARAVWRGGLEADSIVDVVQNPDPTNGKVRMRLHRGRVRLRQHWPKRGGL